MNVEDFIRKNISQHLIDEGYDKFTAAVAADLCVHEYHRMSGASSKRRHIMDDLIERGRLLASKLNGGKRPKRTVH